MNSEQLDLLRRTVLTYGPHLIWVVDKASATGAIEPEEREALSTLLVEAMLHYPDEMSSQYSVAAKYDDLIDRLQDLSPLQERDIDDEEVDRLLRTGKPANE